MTTRTTQGQPHKARVLVVVDVQRDFFDPSGSLYVRGSENLPAKIAAIAADYDAVIFTLDWHPADHCSFRDRGGIWPSHCVAFTQGAGLADEFAPILARGKGDVRLFLKGQDSSQEQYGAFETLEDEDIKAWLESCESVDVCGIAGDYCVKESTRCLLRFVGAEKVALLRGCICSIDDGTTLATFAQEAGIALK